MIIVHLADLHLGFRAYHRSTPTGFNLREADVMASFAQALDRIVDIEPDLLVIAGDFFHMVRPPNAAIAESFRLLSRLVLHLPDLHVVIIGGNSDSPRSTETGNILELFRGIAGVHVVTEEAERLFLRSLDCAVMCLPHKALARHQSTDGGIPELKPNASAARNVLLLHGSIRGETANRKLGHEIEYGGVRIPEEAVNAAQWDYVALGHHHTATELAGNMWYSGAIERTSPNLWLETGDPKGFLTFDTDAGQATFHPLGTRTVVDLPPIRAEGLSPAEVDESIRSAIEAIPGGLDGKIVRLVVHEIPRHVLRELNHRRIREYRAEALHFHLDARSPAVRRTALPDGPLRRRTIAEQVEEYLQKQWEMSSDSLDRDRLVSLGMDYLEAVEDAGSDG
jgi:DNA repair exonuclease SbcCD nuclease subunit